MNDLFVRFESLVREMGGKVSLDCRKAPHQPYLCALLPVESLIQSGDMLSAGAALVIDEDRPELSVYLLRKICNNGAVVADQRTESQFVVEAGIPFESWLQERIEGFRRQEISSAAHRFRLSLFQRMDENQIRQVAYQIVALTGNRGSARRFFQLTRAEWHRTQAHGRRDRGRTPRRFDVINGITAMARDTGNDGLRWQLMNLGGSLIHETSERGDTSGNRQSDRREYMRGGTI